MLHRIAFATVCTTAVLASSAAAQTTWYVDVAGSPPGSGTLADPYTSIQFAIAQASTVHGDVIEVAPGTYVENVDFLKKAITLESSGGPSLTEVVAAGAGHVVVMNASENDGGCDLEGFTVRGATAAQFAGIFVPLDIPTSTYSQAFVRRCIVRGNAGRGIDVRYDGFVHRTTIWGNGGAGFISASISSAQLASSIEWANGARSENTGAFVSTDYCIVSDASALPGGNVLVADPRLWDPANGDFHPMPGSPAVNSAAPWEANDPDGSEAERGALTFDAAHVAGPVVYCTSKTNALGCLPAIGFTGSPSASSATPFAIDCTQVANDKQGLLFYGYAAKAMPYQGGWLCVLSPVKRTMVQTSGGSTPPTIDCSGQFSFDFDARIQSGIDPALVAGQAFFVQYWYRDPGDPTGFNTGRSDALAAVIGI